MPHAPLRLCAEQLLHYSNNVAKIQILNDILASQVAAGEVVERPASVVKELVENSLDAGAKHVTVEIQRGGTALIRVTDDASGMSREDALLSLERHATSKLKSSEQLESISTLGFRGEAVPSIASVARFRMSTREKGAVAGTEIQVEGGNLRDVRDAGVPEGTAIEVKQLFFNVPARRKFLRAETTEFAHVEYQVRLHALAAPEVRFTLIKDGRSVFDLPAAEDWRVRISSLAGHHVAGELMRIPRCEGQGVAVQGYLLPSEYARKGKRQQFIFLNGRPIEDAAITRALRDGFKGGIVDGVNPAVWLWLEIDPTLVDVNVHPAKKEVRFRRPFDVRNLIANAVERALIGDLPVQDNKPVAEKVLEYPAADLPAVSPRAAAAVEQESVELPVSQSSVIAKDFPHRTEQQQDLVTPKGIEMVEQPDFQIIGPLHNRYIVLEGDEGVVLLDPVAARERIVYENLIKAADGEPISSQGLLVPELLELDAVDADMVLRHAEHFSEAGMQVDSFGGSTVQVTSLPAFLNVSDVRGFLLELVDELTETVGSKRGKAVAFETFAAGIARRVGRHELCEVSHAERLLAAMFTCDLPYCTPDGRPTLIHISLNELDRKFGK